MMTTTPWVGLATDLTTTDVVGESYRPMPLQATPPPAAPTPAPRPPTTPRPRIVWRQWLLAMLAGAAITGMGVACFPSFRNASTPQDERDGGVPTVPLTPSSGLAPAGHGATRAGSAAAPTRVAPTITDTAPTVKRPARSHGPRTRPDAAPPATLTAPAAGITASPAPASSPTMDLAHYRDLQRGF